MSQPLTSSSSSSSAPTAPPPPAPPTPPSPISSHSPLPPSPYAGRGDPSLSTIPWVASSSLLSPHTIPSTDPIAIITCQCILALDTLGEDVREMLQTHSKAGIDIGQDERIYVLLRQDIDTETKTDINTHNNSPDAGGDKHQTATTEEKHTPLQHQQPQLELGELRIDNNVQPVEIVFDPAIETGIAIHTEGEIEIEMEPSHSLVTDPIPVDTLHEYRCVIVTFDWTGHKMISYRIIHCGIHSSSIRSIQPFLHPSYSAEYLLLGSAHSIRSDGIRQLNATIIHSNSDRCDDCRIIRTLDLGVGASDVLVDREDHIIVGYNDTGSYPHSPDFHHLVRLSRTGELLWCPSHTGYHIFDCYSINLDDKNDLWFQFMDATTYVNYVGHVIQNKEEQIQPDPYHSQGCALISATSISSSSVNNTAHVHPSPSRTPSRAIFCSPHPDLFCTYDLISRQQLDQFRLYNHEHHTQIRTTPPYSRPVWRGNKCIIYIPSQTHNTRDIMLAIHAFD